MNKNANSADVRCLTRPTQKAWKPLPFNPFFQRFLWQFFFHFKRIISFLFFCYSNLVSIWKSWLRRRTNVYHTFIFANEFILYHKLLLLSSVFCAVRSSNLALYFDNIYILISYLIFKHAFLNPIFSLHILFARIKVALHLLIVEIISGAIYFYISLSFV